MRKNIVMVLLLVLLVGTLAACGGGDGGDAGYKDGTYLGEADGFGGTLKVSVEIKDGKIANVEVTDHDESEGFSEEALADVPSAIVSKNSADVEAVSGATTTSDAIKEAVSNALEAAK